MSCALQCKELDRAVYNNVSECGVRGSRLGLLIIDY
jgi:hypothetical protein